MSEQKGALAAMGDTGPAILFVSCVDALYLHLDSSQEVCHVGGSHVVEMRK